MPGEFKLASLSTYCQILDHLVVWHHLKPFIRPERRKLMKLKFALLFAAVLAVTILSSTDFTPASSAAPQEKVQVCHKSGNGSFHLISISSNAESAHNAHGDGRPGDPVPNMAGFIFGDNCTPTTAPPVDLATGCYKLVNNPPSVASLDVLYIGPIDILGNTQFYFETSNGTCEGSAVAQGNAGIIAAGNLTEAEIKCASLSPGELTEVHDLGAPTGFIPSAPGFWLCTVAGAG